MKSEKAIHVWIVFSALIITQANAQVKVGDSPSNVNPDAVLEIESTNKGLLLPRVELTATSDSAPMNDHVEGMTVYNTATTGDVTPGYYYNNGTIWVRLSDEIVNIYNVNGTLTDNRTVTMDGNSLSFNSTNQRTFLSSVGGLLQQGLNTSTFDEGSIQISAPDNNGDGVRTNLYLQAFSENVAQIFAGEEATALTLGTHFTNQPAPIVFTTTGIGAQAGTEKVRISPDGSLGIDTPVPTEKLDVNGNVRVRNINSNVGDGTIDRRVVADAGGVLKTLDSDDYTFFHAQLASDQTLSSAALANTILFDTPVATSPFYAYDNATGILTFNDPGLYYITLQGGFTEFVAGDHLLLGILDHTTGLYIGRGSHWAAVDRSGGVGQIFNYITMINVPSAGFQIRYIAFASNSGNGVLLANESGASGSGNVTNITIQKTK